MQTSVDSVLASTAPPVAADTAELEALAARPGPAAALTATLARRLVEEPGTAGGLLELVARRHASAGRLVEALVAPTVPEARLLARTWRCAGWDRLTAPQRESLAADGLHGWVPVPADAAEAASWLDDLRERMAPLVARRAVAGELDSGELADLARVVALDADLWTLRSRSALARWQGTGRSHAHLEALWALEADDRRDLARQLERGAVPPSPGTVTSRLRLAAGPDALAELRSALAEDPDHARLVRVVQALDREDLAVPDPARGLGLLLAVAGADLPVRLVAADPDPLLMAVFVLERGTRGEVRFPLPPGRGEEARGHELDLPDGVTLGEAALDVDCGAAALAAADVDDDAKATRKESGNSALKAMVLGSMQSISAVLAFLRDPKVAAIPGLVEEVVVRTRNPQVLETIATDRTLHGGFANRGVPLALLKSPVNVSIKIIRRFVHVKYVSKIDLKRMAVDQAGIRKEVNREVVKYMDALV